jgi:hypothetical protein
MTSDGSRLIFLAAAMKCFLDIGLNGVDFRLPYKIPQEKMNASFNCYFSFARRNNYSQNWLLTNGSCSLYCSWTLQTSLNKRALMRIPLGVQDNISTNARLSSKKMIRKSPRVFALGDLPT